MSGAVGEHAELVVRRIGAPLDVWAVLATLEAEGLRDDDARARFARPHLLAYAEDVYAVARRLEAAPVAAPSPPSPPSARRTFARGLLRVAPVALQVAVGSVAGASLLGARALPPRDALLVDVAALTSGVVAGATTTSLQARVASPLETGDGRAVASSLASSLGVGLVASLGALAAAAALWGLAAAGPWAELARFGAHHAAFTALWLALATLNTLHMEALALALTAPAALLVAAATSRGAHPGAAVLAGDVAVAGLAAVAVIRRVRALVRAQGRRATSPRPPDALALGARVPAMALGGAYLALLLVDRLVVWTADVPRASRVAYEVDAGLALAASCVPALAAEHLAERFEYLGARDAEGTRGASVEAYRERARARVDAALTSILALSLACAVGAWAVARAAGHRGSWVYWASSAGDALFVVGAFGALLHLQSARVWPAARALLGGVVVAAVVGWAASRALATSCAALGLVAGAAVFAARTARGARALAARLDHARYAAF